jgi:hypothetical protein
MDVQKSDLKNLFFTRSACRRREIQIHHLFIKTLWMNRKEITQRFDSLDVPSRKAAERDWILSELEPNVIISSSRFEKLLKAVDLSQFGIFRHGIRNTWN